MTWRVRVPWALALAASAGAALAAIVALELPVEWPAAMFAAAAVAVALLPIPPPLRTAAHRAERAVRGLEETCARARAEHDRELDPRVTSGRRRAELVFALADELKTPLGTIRGFADLLLDEVDGPLPAGAREEVGLIRDAGAYLHLLLDEVLEVASGGVALSRSTAEVELGRVVWAACELVRPRAAARGLELRIHGVDAAPSVRTDARRLQQIVLNLVANAVKFTAEGTVTVVVDADEHEARITVADTGPGIALADRARIFSAFERVEPAADGHGLGLWIARELAASIGARLELLPAAEGARGASFRVSVPRAGAPGDVPDGPPRGRT